MIPSIPVGAKIGVSEFFYTHVGVYLGNDQVFHNHWRNGAEIISLREFANGKSFAVLSQGAVNIAALYQRAQHLLSLRRAYDVLRYNCEHAASFVREGVPSSPQILFYGAVSLIAMGIGLASAK